MLNWRNNCVDGSQDELRIQGQCPQNNNKIRSKLTGHDVSFSMSAILTTGHQIHLHIACTTYNIYSLNK